MVLDGAGAVLDTNWCWMLISAGWCWIGCWIGYRMLIGAG